MKRLLIVMLALALLLGPAALAGGCSYYDLHGVHDWYQSDVSLPTCESDGYYELTCASCGVTEKHLTDGAYGHHYEEVGDWTDSTCMTKGWHTMRCANCSDEVVFALPLAAHSWYDTGAGQKPTCQVEGWRKEECAVCGATRTISLGKAEHKWVSTGGGVPSTCVASGFAEEECSECGQIRTYTLPLGEHSYGAWIITVPTTDHSMGVRVRSCAVCGASETQSFYPDGTIYRNGPKGDAVRAAQQRLIELGYLSDKADGVFGAKTEKAIQAFQAAQSLVADGIGWPQTLALLAAAGIEDPPVCCALHQEDVQHGYYIPCDRHAELIAFEAQLNAQGDAASYQAWASLCAAWEEALGALYDQWTAACAPGDAQVVRAAQAGFDALLDALDTADNASDALSARIRRARCMRDETMRLCSLLNAAAE